MAGISGGLISEFTGGSFIDGFRNGVIAAGLNHVLHELAGPGKGRRQARRVRKILRGINKSSSDATIDSTWDAVKEYFLGDGSSVELGTTTKRNLLMSPEMHYVVKRLIYGKANYRSSRFNVDLTLKTFHVGDTTVQYSTSCSSGNCVTNFSAFFGDSFSDPFDIGIELYRATPYKYNVFNFSINYSNPGYPAGVNIR